MNRDFRIRLALLCFAYLLAFLLSVYLDLDLYVSWGCLKRFGISRVLEGRSLR